MYTCSTTFIGIISRDDPVMTRVPAALPHRLLLLIHGHLEALSSLQSGLHGFPLCSHCDAQQSECSAEWAASKASTSHLYRCVVTSYPSLWHYSTSSWYLALFFLMMITGIGQQDLRDVGVMVLGNLSCLPKSTCSCQFVAVMHRPVDTLDCGWVCSTALATAMCLQGRWKLKPSETENHAHLTQWLARCVEVGKEAGFERLCEALFFHSLHNWSTSGSVHMCIRVQHYVCPPGKTVWKWALSPYLNDYPISPPSMTAVFYPAFNCGCSEQL